MTATYVAILLLCGAAMGFRTSTTRFTRAGSGILSLSASTSQSAASVDLTSDGGVKKTILSSGSGKKVEAGDILAVRYKAKTADGAIFAQGDKERFVHADGSLIKGWDLAVSSMKVGEVANVKISSTYGYGGKGVKSVIAPEMDLELELNILAWLGNEMRPESLFQKDLDIDPFIASSPEEIQAEYDDMQESFQDKYSGNFLEIYWRRFKNISFGFGGSGFFTSQSGERPPWYLNPNLTFPAMILFSIGTFGIVLLSGSIKEKGEKAIDPDLTWAPMEKRQILGEREAKSFFVKAKVPPVPTNGYDEDLFA